MNSHIRPFAAISIFCVMAGTLAAQTSCLLNLDEFVKDWSQSKQFTLDVANAMPAEFYNFKPNPAEMSFGEQMLHIAASNVYRFHQITGAKPPFELDPKKMHPGDKAFVVKALQQSFDYVMMVLLHMKPEQLQRTFHIPDWKGRTDPDARAMIMNMFVHTAHHRAQCEVYLRLKNITPPTYTF